MRTRSSSSLNRKTKMAALGSGVSSFSKFIWKSPELAGFGFQQVRNKWVDWRMIRDVKRRNLVKELAVERLCINSLRKNNILPPELRELADQEIHALPRDSSLVRVRNRCVLTSRARSVIPRWRISRIMFRELADYNKLAGVQRAIW